MFISIVIDSNSNTIDLILICLLFTDYIDSISLNSIFLIQFFVRSLSRIDQLYVDLWRRFWNYSTEWAPKTPMDSFGACKICEVFTPVS